MTFYIVYEYESLATLDSEAVGPYHSFSDAQEEAKTFDAHYDTCIITQLNGIWYRVEDMDEELFAKPLEEDQEYWLPLAQVSTLYSARRRVPSPWDI